MAAAFLTGSLAMGGCSASSTNETARPGATATSEASPLKTTAPSTAAVSIAGRICEGFFTQAQPNDQEWMVGRPVVDAAGFPEDVEANPAGVQVTQREHSEGAVNWYTFKGEHVSGIGQITCHDAPLHAKELTLPNHTRIWVATTNQAAETPRTWDAQALDPHGFGGASIDYGNVSAHDRGDILLQASRTIQ